MTDSAADSVLDRLIQALAAQLADPEPPVLAPGAVEALSGLSRPEARLLFGLAGHLVHYGSDTESLSALVELVTNIQRAGASADMSLAPGDKVRLVGDLPDGASKYDPAWLAETTFVVRYVGDDDTVDLQPDFSQDYVIETFPIANVRVA